MEQKYFDLMLKFESEGLGEGETCELFQYLVDTGLAWSLQGFYGRTAKDLIEQGMIDLKGHKANRFLNKLEGD